MAEFKLSRFKYTWRNIWAADADYLNDDIVRYGTEIYVCVAPHTAAPDFYTDLNATTPRWVLMAAGTTWRGDWSPSTYYYKGDVAKVGGTAYICTQAHTSVSLESNFLTDISNWTVLIFSLEWLGDWSTGYYYQVGDIVKDHGNVYQCITAHTSAGDYIDDTIANWSVILLDEKWTGEYVSGRYYTQGDIAKFGGNVYICNDSHLGSNIRDDVFRWNVVHESIEYKGNYSSGVTYKPNDLVKYGASLYKSNVDFVATSTFESSNWDFYTPGQMFERTWSELTVYQIGDIVKYAGNLYVSTDANNLNSVPTDLAEWTLLFEGNKIRGIYDIRASYLVGDIVNYGGNLFRAKLNSVGERPDGLDDGSTNDNEFWETIITGISWKDTWQDNYEYRIGDVVVWKGSSYKCIESHVSENVNRPDDDPLLGMGSEAGTGDSTLFGTYWAKITQGNRSNKLAELGDIKVFGNDEDGSTIGATRLTIGQQGQALKVSSGQAGWADVWESASVFYVSLAGNDVPTAGNTPTNPWRTLRYACENVTGPATIFVRTGFYEEILPIRVPAFVAIVGDELRSTVIAPANKPISDQYLTNVIQALTYIQSIISDVISETVLTDLYSDDTQIITGDPPAIVAVPAAAGLVGKIISWLSNGISESLSGTNTITTNADILKSAYVLGVNKNFLISEAIAYLEYTDETFIAPSRMRHDINKCLDAVWYDIRYPGNWKSTESVNFFINGNDYTVNKLQNMFLLRDGTGLRNMTLVGLEGVLLPGDTNPVTRRPTGGAFTSLDPGWGPADSSAWVGTKSPYVQNVTTFGEACVGLKVDGDLHNGGNQTIVANDFTQIISDGIGVWCNKKGKTEVVSVFTYYNHIGYMCTDGGKIRGTNGNCSYGRFGALSSGFDPTESPITAVINNRYYDATVSQVYNNSTGGITNVFYSNAGVHYSSATGVITGSGLEADLSFDEFRDGALYEARILDPGDSSAAGGAGYTVSRNASQGGDNISVTLSGADANTPEDYRGLRLVITSGTGIGQYGYIAEFDDVSKVVWIGDENSSSATIVETASTGNVLSAGTNISSFKADDAVIFTGTKFGNVQDITVYYIKEILSSSTFTISETQGGSSFNLINETGEMTMHRLAWRHFTPGYDIESVLDNTSNYSIEPRITFSSPGYSLDSFTMATTTQIWNSAVFGNGRFVAISEQTDIFAYSDDGETWTSVNVGMNTLWNKVRYVNGNFIAVSRGGVIAVSTNGSSWSIPTTPSYEFTDIAYGNGKYVISCSGTNIAVSSTDLITWSTVALPEGADYTSVVYGKDKFVMVSYGDSSSLNALYSTDGDTWTAITIPGSIKSLEFGNNRFVAIAGGYSGAQAAFISFDGVTWTGSQEALQSANWQNLAYGQGLFVAVANDDSSIAISEDGIDWSYVTGTNFNDSICFGNPSNAGKFLLFQGTNAGQTLTTGAKAKARVEVVSNRITEIKIWEPGSGYTSAPTYEVVDNLNTGDVVLQTRIGVGVLANPTIINRGVGYQTVSTRITISGNGYKDEYHLGDMIVVDNLSRIPGPGDNLVISSITDYVYKLLSVEILTGTVPTATARLRIAKDINRDESPDHGTGIIIRQQYSQVRLTGHDLLDIGLGNFIETNYPNTLFPIGTVPAPENQVYEENGGRVFYTSTDQDGNFRVGELFAVEQATGTVTLNAQFFELEGLEEIALGGVTVGGSGVVIREFSTDPLFVADSNNIIPTQKAIKAFLNRRVSGGGSDAITGQISAGEVLVGPAQISTTTGSTIQWEAKANFKQPIAGDWLIQSWFLSGSGEVGE